PLFFVISGYCITATLDARRRANESVFVYFARRFRRIYPAYWFAVALSVAVVFAGNRLCGAELFSSGHFIISPPGELSGRQWLGNLSLTESWRHYLGGEKMQYL